MGLCSTKEGSGRQTNYIPRGVGAAGPGPGLLGPGEEASNPQSQKPAQQVVDRFGIRLGNFLNFSSVLLKVKGVMVGFLRMLVNWMGGNRIEEQAEVQQFSLPQGMWPAISM